MKFSTTEQIKDYFNALFDAGFEIPGVYDAADKVIVQKMKSLVHEGNKNNLEINVEKLIDSLGLKKIKSFSEMKLVISEYFSQFNETDKLNESLSKIRLVGTEVSGKSLEDAQKEFRQSVDSTWSWGTIIDLRKTVKFSIGRLDYYSHSDTYHVFHGYETGQAINFILKYFFDVELESLTKWDGKNVGKWVDYGNNLMGRVYKNGTFEIKHPHLDVLTKEINHYFRTNYTNYFIRI